MYSAVRSPEKCHFISAAMNEPERSHTCCCQQRSLLSAASHCCFLTSEGVKWKCNVITFIPAYTKVGPAIHYLLRYRQGAERDSGLFWAYLHRRLPFSSWAPHQMVISGSNKGMLLSVFWFAQVLAVMETACFLVATVRIRIHLCWTSWVTYRSCR